MEGPLSPRRGTACSAEALAVAADDGMSTDVPDSSVHKLFELAGGGERHEAGAGGQDVVAKLASDV